MGRAGCAGAQHSPWGRNKTVAWGLREAGELQCRVAAHEPLFPGGRKWIIREDEAVSPGALPLGHVSLGASSPALATGFEVGSGTPGQPPCLPSGACLCPGPSSVQQARSVHPSQPATQPVSASSVDVSVCPRLGVSDCSLHVAERACLGHMPALCLSHVPMAVDTATGRALCGVPGRRARVLKWNWVWGTRPVCPGLTPQSSRMCVLCLPAELWVRCVRCVGNIRSEP